MHSVWARFPEKAVIFRVTNLRPHKKGMNLWTPCNCKVSPTRYPEFLVNFRTGLSDFIKRQQFIS